MAKFTATFFIIISILISGEIHPLINSPAHLAECKLKLHCASNEWKAKDVSYAFKKAVEIVSKTPRTNIVKQNDSYIHAEVSSRLMHFVDDLEIKALPNEGTVNVRSESRIGIIDMGVNQKRIDDLSYRLKTNQIQ